MSTSIEPRPPQAKQLELDSGASIGNGGSSVFPWLRSRRWTKSARGIQPAKMRVERPGLIAFYFSSSIRAMLYANFRRQHEPHVVEPYKKIPKPAIASSISTLNRIWTSGLLCTLNKSKTKKHCPNRTSGNLGGSGLNSSSLLLQIICF